jgi:hypothetical protein
VIAEEVPGMAGIARIAGILVTNKTGFKMLGANIYLIHRRTSSIYSYIMMVKLFKK